MVLVRKMKRGKLEVFSVDFVLLDFPFVPFENIEEPFPWLFWQEASPRTLAKREAFVFFKVAISERSSVQRPSDLNLKYAVPTVASHGSQPDPRPWLFLRFLSSRPSLVLSFLLYLFIIR
jgi:hypothetical protein